ncbi:MAG TPA: hypothetical protein VG826_29200 [Pirellulales bacterium]|nr:hypothetical protein [Pirellulales bacterium]
MAQLSDDGHRRNVDSWIDRLSRETARNFLIGCAALAIAIAALLVAVFK